MTTMILTRLGHEHLNNKHVLILNLAAKTVYFQITLMQFVSDIFVKPVKICKIDDFLEVFAVLRMIFCVKLSSNELAKQPAIVCYIFRSDHLLWFCFVVCWRIIGKSYGLHWMRLHRKLLGMNFWLCFKRNRTNICVEKFAMLLQRWRETIWTMTPGTKNGQQFYNF